MRKMEIRSIEELSDSRIMFEKKLPSFGYMLLVLITSLFAFFVFWSIKTPKNYMVIATGTITNKEANYVMCTYTGEIDECYLEEGKLVRRGDTLLTIKSTDYNLQEEQLLINKEAYNHQIEQYDLLVQSIVDDENHFDSSDPEDSLYYNTYEAYKAQIKQYTVDTSMYENYGYKEEQIQAELDKNQGKISQLYYDTLRTAENAISDARLQIAMIDAQLASLQSGKSEYVIRASTDGILHLVADLKSGMVIQATTTIGTITPQNAEPIIEAFVSTADMARIHVGDDVRIVIDGLAQNVYGTIEGTVDHIDSDLSVQNMNDGSMKGFKIHIKMNANYLVSKRAEKIDVVNGMTATTRITYNKITWFDYFVEKMGIKNI